MSARTPDPLDVMVGARIRILRHHRGTSQGELAGKIGVTFQQVQKYENGINRVGASRLSRVASALGVSVGELFQSTKHTSAAGGSPLRLLAERDALRVVTAFSRTTSPRVRRAITKLLESIADRPPVVKPAAARPLAAKLPARDFDHAGIVSARHRLRRLDLPRLHTHAARHLVVPP